MYLQTAYQAALSLITPEPQPGNAKARVLGSSSGHPLRLQRRPGPLQFSRSQL